MHKLSRERVERLARELLDAMLGSRAVVLIKDRDAVCTAIAHALADEFRREDEREESVRRRLSSMRNVPQPRSPEWEQIFRRLMEEEYLREGPEG